jgi:ATP-dependent RNA helicase DDX54/DBP10
MLTGRVARAGRSGTAYSIICPDEIASLLDLHLFLGRPLKFSADTATAESTDSAVSVVGRMPQDLLDEEHSFLKNLLETKAELVF